MGPITFQRPEFAAAEKKWNARFLQNAKSAGTDASVRPSCRTCKHWSEKDEGFGTCANAASRELLRVLGGYMLCHAAYGCVMHEPNGDSASNNQNTTIQ